MSASALATGARERLQRVASAAGEHDLDVLLVSGAVNVRYVTGFSGTTGLVLIAAGGTDRADVRPHRFITDFRYATQAREQVLDAFEREVADRDVTLEDTPTGTIWHR